MSKYILALIIASFIFYTCIILSFKGIFSKIWLGIVPVNVIYLSFWTSSGIVEEDFGGVR